MAPGGADKGARNKFPTKNKDQLEKSKNRPSWPPPVTVGYDQGNRDHDGFRKKRPMEGYEGYREEPRQSESRANDEGSSSGEKRGSAARDMG